MAERVRDERQKHILLVALCAGAVGFCLAFVAPAFYPLRVLWYYPLEHRLSFELAPDGLAMDFFGRCLAATVAGGVAYGLAWAIARRLKTLSSGALVLWVAWMTTAALLAMSLFTYQLVRRHPRPLPLPAWYEPR
jgi:hypothetical protein